jgi:hypothetical protein
MMTVAACNRVLFIAAGSPQRIKMIFSVIRNGNTLINELCNMKYCLPISDLLQICPIYSWKERLF